jgi:glycosyltransferase involved in cell wall biosynthesis
MRTIIGRVLLRDERPVPLGAVLESDSLQIPGLYDGLSFAATGESLAVSRQIQSDARFVDRVGECAAKGPNGLLGSEFGILPQTFGCYYRREIEFDYAIKESLEHGERPCQLLDREPAQGTAMMMRNTQSLPTDLRDGMNGERNGRRDRFSFERVLHIGKYYPPYDGGMESVVRELVSRQSIEFPVKVVVANDHPATVIEFRDGAEITRVARFGTLASQPICPTLPFHLTAARETLVHLHFPNPWAAQAYLMSGHKGKLIVTHHADTEGRRFLRKFTDPVVRRAMKRAAAIIVTSRRYLDSSAELTDFRHKCQVVPLGIDLVSCDEDSPEVAAIRAKYGESIVLAIGRLVPYKGFEYLLKSMVEIDATLLVIGTGPGRETLEDTVRKLGLGAKVHLLGHVREVGPWYKAARLLAMPSISRAEAFGLVQVEAMATGIPVVNTNIDSGVPDVSLHGITGITVPPRNTRALVDAIELLLKNPEMRLNYGRAGAIRAREEFSCERMAQRTFSVYASV